MFILKQHKYRINERMVDTPIILEAIPPVLCIFFYILRHGRQAEIQTLKVINNFIQEFFTITHTKLLLSF